MKKWVAKFNEGDEAYGEEIYLAISGGETGFEVTLSNEEASDVMPGMTREEAMENLMDIYGFYDTFTLLQDED